MRRTCFPLARMRARRLLCVLPARAPSVMATSPAAVAPLAAVLFTILSIAGMIIPGTARAADDVRLLRQFSDATEPAARRDICKQILDMNPSSWARSFCLGYGAVLAGIDQAADSLFQVVLADQPGFGLAAILYAQGYEQTGKLDRAEAYYRKAIELQPERTDARYALGTLLLRRGQEQDPKYFPQALEVFREMTEQDSSSPDGWSSMGLTLTYMNRLKDAEEMFQKAITKSPKDPALYDNLASLYAREDRNAEAEANWRKALSLNPGYGKSVVEISSLYGRTGKLAQAIRTLEEGRRAVTAPPWGARILRNLGFVYLRIGQRGFAYDRLSRAVEDGYDALAYLGLAHLYMTGDSLANGIPLLERGAEMDSALAVPFVRAWRSELEGKVENKPALRRVLRGGAASSGPAGKEATPSLAAFVLEGWSFENADTVMQELGTAASAVSEQQYDTAPVAIKQVPADYPETLQEQGEGGSVDVLVTVDETGRVAEAKIQSCRAPIPLCESALDAAKRYLFQPAMRFGHPVKATIVLPFRFVKRG